ncbi:MAG: glycosyltransferase, partial [Arenibacter sp.]
MQKVLIITYYWPPAGGPGVQRWLKFVKYLRDFDIEPIVYIPENPNYPIVDESLTQEIPAGIKVYKKPIYEPYGFARIFSKKKTKKISAGIINSKNQSVVEKVMLWIRGNLFIPDARKFWIKPSVDFLQAVIAQEKIGTVITTGPPHSLHLIGLELKKRTQIRWVTDFRDPWTSIGYHKKLKLTKASQEKHKQLEHLVLNEADKIIVTSNTTRQEFSHITQKPITVITNGYDTSPGNSVALDVDFTISHI